MHLVLQLHPLLFPDARLLLRQLSTQRYACSSCFRCSCPPRAGPHPLAHAAPSVPAGLSCPMMVHWHMQPSAHS